nr:MAG TPA: hypothetical protein [Herelleviridae sp.]
MNFTEVISPNGDSSLIDVTNPPILIRRGTLSIKTKIDNKAVEKAIYIVELAEETSGTDVVSVYKAKTINGVVQKDFVTEEVKQGYKSTTFLGDLAQKVKGSDLRGKRYISTKPPLFLAPVVFGKDTFTGVEERGFYEREEDRHVIQDGKPAIQFGDNTGVFIGLSSIKWERVYVDMNDVAKGYLANKQVWFNLEGNNPQFKSEV